MSFLETCIQKLKVNKYSGIATESFLDDCTRLEKGEPYEYVLGCTDFLGAHIDLSGRPMIPRPETAFWVKRAIEELRDKEKTQLTPFRFAEVFAGGGAIGIALARHFPTASIVISEIDPKLKSTN